MNIYARVRARCAVVFASLMLLAGCGGADAPMPTETGCEGSASCGTAYIAMTDADGDFQSYTVDVVSLKLRKASGAEVETLPNRTRVDFAQYVDLTEFLTAATIPNGAYVEGTLRLDYTNAAVSIERNGQAVAAQVVSGSGVPLGIVDVRIVLDNRRHLIVAPGRPSLLTLDFNLAATNTVDLTTTPVTVTARPTLIASLDPIEQKEMRLRGPLVSVDTAANTYTLDVRPFHHPQARHGRVTVHTTSSTAFEINGVASTGSAGLQALAAAGPGTATVAFGTLAANRTFIAERVHAGTSVPGQGVDTLIGTIVSRSGNELTVRGGTIVRADAGATDERASFLRGDVKVLVGTNTVVLKDGAGIQMLGAQALSVGQSIHVHGSVATSGSVVTIDATQGRVRMHHSQVFGTVVNQNPGSLTMNIAAINGRPIDIFNFAGTGITSLQDADPANYEVQTPPAGVLQLATGEPARVFGFVTPFGLAPPDFEARTWVSYRELRAQLAIGWSPDGSTAPFTSLNSSGVVLNLADPAISLPHHIHVGPVRVDLLSLPASPTIVGDDGETMYVIVTAASILHYSNFADFVGALSSALDGSTRLVRFTATGSYEVGANTLTASAAAAILR